MVPYERGLRVDGKKKGRKAKEGPALKTQLSPVILHTGGFGMCPSPGLRPFPVWAVFERVPYLAATDRHHLPVFANDTHTPCHPRCSQLRITMCEGALGRHDTHWIGTPFRLPRATFRLPMAAFAATKTCCVFARRGFVIVGRVGGHRIEYVYRTHLSDVTHLLSRESIPAKCR